METISFETKIPVDNEFVSNIFSNFHSKSVIVSPFNGFLFSNKTPVHGEHSWIKCVLCLHNILDIFVGHNLNWNPTILRKIETGKKYDHYNNKPPEQIPIPSRTPKPSASCQRLPVKHQEPRERALYECTRILNRYGLPTLNRNEYSIWVILESKILWNIFNDPSLRILRACYAIFLMLKSLVLVEIGFSKCVCSFGLLEC